MTAMEPTKQFVMAVKREAENQVPGDWHSQLSAIEGVELQNASGKFAHFQASDDALERVRSLFSNDFHIEEVAERNPL